MTFWLVQTQGIRMLIPLFRFVPEDAPIYTGHSLFNITKSITLFFIVQSLLHHNPPHIWTKIIQITIQIECLHGTKYLDLDCDLDHDPDNFAPSKCGISCSCMSIENIFHRLALVVCLNTMSQVKQHCKSVIDTIKPWPQIVSTM